MNLKTFPMKYDICSTHWSKNCPTKHPFMCILHLKRIKCCKGPSPLISGPLSPLDMEITHLLFAHTTIKIIILRESLRLQADHNRSRLQNSACILHTACGPVKGRACKKSSRPPSTLKIYSLPHSYPLLPYSDGDGLGFPTTWIPPPLLLSRVFFDTGDRSSRSGDVGCGPDGGGSSGERH